jgi:hypothetical protein
MAKHHERIIAPCFDICTFAIFDPYGLGNASLGYEFADIAATIAGETVSGIATPRKLYSFRGRPVRCSAAASCSLM